MNNTQSGADIHLLTPNMKGAEASRLRKAFFRERYNYFTLENGWDTVNETGLETDSFDPGADFLLLTSGDELLAGCRFIRREQGPLPIQGCISPDYSISPNSIEISRLVSREGGHVYIPLFYEQLLTYIGEQPGPVYMTIREKYLKRLRERRVDNRLIKPLPGIPLKEVSRNSGREELFYPAELERDGIPELLAILQMTTRRH